MTDEVKVTATKLLTDLQLSKNNFTQSIPLSDEAYEKQCDSYKNGGRVNVQTSISRY